MGTRSWIGSLGALSLALVGSAGCLRPSGYVCDSDAECGDGRCEASGACSFADPDCASGWRVGSNGPPELAGTCVGIDAGAGEGWYDAAWTFRKPITIPAGNLMADLDDFVVLISLSADAELAAAAQGDGADLVFTAADGTTRLAHEVERHVADTGELVAWVAMPTLSSSRDNLVYLYYGNPAADDQQQAAAVWAAGYSGVWHLREDPTAGLRPILDSTAAANHGAAVGAMTADDLVTGPIGGALHFDGEDDGVVVLDSPVLSAGSGLTVAIWAQPDRWGGCQSDCRASLVVKANRETEKEYRLRFIQPSDELEWHVSSDGDDEAPTSADVRLPIATVSVAEWHQLVGTWDAATGTSSLYVDGALLASGTLPVSALYDGPAALGIATAGDADASTNVDNFAGTIAEVQVSNLARDAAWISAAFANQASPSTFHVIGAAETR